MRPSPHLRSTPDSLRIAHRRYPNAPRGERTPKPMNPAEFLAIGPGGSGLADQGSGDRRIRAKMADAVALAKLYGTADIDHAGHRGNSGPLRRGGLAADP
ncbi:hypothetical protein GCM10027612_87910 [Microbispora bryophytorum subsp. camponoti]